MIKQVIVMRRQYPENSDPAVMRKLRLGKMIAQGSHASMAFLSNKVRHNLPLSEVEKEWINNSFTKICLYVDTEQELLSIEQEAKNNSITCYVITDNGQTEFNGVPTKTCLALGPDYSENIDKITKHLKLL